MSVRIEIITILYNQYIELLETPIYYSLFMNWCKMKIIFFVTKMNAVYYKKNVGSLQWQQCLLDMYLLLLIPIEMVYKKGDIWYQCFPLHV